MAPRALVTGGAGFVGGWLRRALAEGGYAVTALAQALPEQTPARVEDAPTRWILGDVRDAAHLARGLDEGRPDVIMHLAGVSYVPAAGDDTSAALEVNVLAASRLLGLVRERRDAGALDPVVLVIGSGEQYGRHDAAELPLDERAEQRPHNVYAATKTAQEAVALAAWRSDGVRVIAARSFNHSGPGQDPRFLLPGLARRARALRDAPAGGALRMGNQSPVRDFLHVADVVEAYRALAERGRPGEAYNVASGRGTSVGDVARRLLARAGVDAPVESDPALMRAADVPALVGSPAKLAAHTGWSPQRSLDDLLDDLLDEVAARPAAAPA